MKSKIYYAISDRVSGEPMMSMMFGWSSIKDRKPELAKKLSNHDLSSSHKLLAVVDETDLDKIFQNFQGENWSPNGEAKELILGLGLGHTTISVGDIVQQDDNFYFCDGIGWIKI